MSSTPPDTTKAEDAALADLAIDFRRLKANELVSQGDFVPDGRCGFEPWEGPGGFRADAFVKPIYRKQARLPSATRKLP